MVTLNLTSFGTAPSIGDISQALQDTGLTSSEVNRVVVASSAAIPTQAFQSWSNLQVVENMDTCVGIGSYAFADTNMGLTYDSGPYLVDIGNCSSIGEGAFSGCGYLQYISLASSASVPDYCFKCCQSLSSVQNLEHVVSIGAEAFRSTSVGGWWVQETGQYGFADIGNCSSIGSGAFSGCRALYSISLASGVSIPDYCFEYCDSLSSVINLEHVVSIGGFAFKDTRIGWGLYGKSEELANIGYIGSEAFWGAHLGESCDSSEQGGQDSDRGLWVDRNCVYMGAQAFAQNPNLRWIGLPGPSHDISNISEMDQRRRLYMDNGQFSGCSGLSNIINLEFQKSFSTNAIVGCNSMTFLNLFYVDEVVNCSSTDLSDVPISGIHIGPQLASRLDTMVGLFQGCSMLEHVIVATSTEADGYQFSIPDNCFSGIATLTSVEGLYSCSGIGSHAFAGTNIEFSNPDQLMYVQNIGDYAFNGTEVDVGYLGNCGYIGAGAFAYNPNISELVFGPCMCYIGEEAFESCVNLNVVYFNNNVYPSITMGSNAFANCGNLAEVCLTNTAQTIRFGYQCFCNDSYLDHIYNLNTVYSGSFGDCMFYNTNVQENTINIYYPDQIGGSAFRGIYHDWYLPNISMSQVPMDTKWGLESGMKMHLRDGVIEG